jgi:hypothetical protein
MANHKRGRAKNRRAGCLFCKPHKANGAKQKDPPSVQRKLQSGRATQELDDDYGPDEGPEYFAEGEIYTDMNDSSYVVSGGKLVPTSEVA